MIKEISTYGALLLTTMIVIRAATMEKESEADVRSLYERNADNAYISNNLDLREHYITYNATPQDLLAFTSKAETILEPNTREAAHLSLPEVNENDVTTYADIVELGLEDELVLDTEVNLDEAANGLSLDRESTINSGLSLLFPRQRINPRPAPGQLQE